MSINYEDFEKVDIRVGKITEVNDFPEARNPAFKLKIDFGLEIGTKVSSVQAVGAHTKEELLGMLVVCVVNFPPKRIGSFASEVLTLGFKNTDGVGWVLITPAKNSVQVGSKLRSIRFGILWIMGAWSGKSWPPFFPGKILLNTGILIGEKIR